MHRLTAILLLLALLGAAPLSFAQTSRKAPGISVLSIIPSQGEPGMTVTLNGSGFTDRTAAFLGATQLPVRVVSDRILSIDIPDLSPGLYALYLKREDGSTSKPYNFLVQPQKPIVSSISPETVNICASGREREVVVAGRAFLPGSKVVFDGAAIGTRFISNEQLSFITPQLPGGLHQVQVKNPSDALSGTTALFIETKPEISNVVVGNDYVSAYELIVNGRNFTNDTILIVDGDRVGTGRPAVADRDRLIYISCTQLIYQRHPYDPTPKDIRLQVQNPSGEASSVMVISAP